MKTVCWNNRLNWLVFNLLEKRSLTPFSNFNMVLCKTPVTKWFREMTWAKFKTSRSSVWSLCLWLKIHDKDPLSRKFWISHIPNPCLLFVLRVFHFSRQKSNWDIHAHFGFSLSSSRSRAQWPSRPLDPSSRRSNLRKFFLFLQGRNENYR